VKRLIKLLIKEEAKQVGTLYHYTSISNLKRILNSDVLRIDSKNSISFTRNQNFDYVIRGIGSSLECRLEIDGDKLSNNYKIKPYNEQGFTINDPKKFEQEEIVKENISPIIPYIIKITLYKDVNNFAQTIKDKWNLNVDIIEKEINKKYDFKSQKFYYQPLSEDFMRENADELNWKNISQFQSLSESFMREFINRIDGTLISQYQILSESFIEEFQDKLYWPNIFSYQILSEPFIKKFKDKTGIVYVLQNKNIILSPEFRKELE